MKLWSVRRTGALVAANPVGYGVRAVVERGLAGRRGQVQVGHLDRTLGVGRVLGGELSRRGHHRQLFSHFGADGRFAGRRERQVPLPTAELGRCPVSAVVERGPAGRRRQVQVGDLD